MDSEERFDQANDVRSGQQRETDPAYDASATGLAGVPSADAAGETSKTGVAGSSTFDPRVSPAHEGLAGSPAYGVGERHDSERPDTSDERRNDLDDQP